MFRRKRGLVALMVAALTLFVGARGAGAQDFSLQLKNGLVTLTAREVSVPQILDRWAQIGGTTIVNRENLKRAVVTLQLNEVPEGAALAILLRDVGGYILAERTEDRQGASVIDRIFILPTSSVPVRGPSQPALVGIAQDFDNATEPPITREPDVQEPEPLGSAPTRPRPTRVAMPQRGSPTLGFTPPTVPQSAPAAAGSQADTPLPRANPFGAITASVRPGEVTSQPPPPLPQPSPSELQPPQP